jgi:hypothetical protein
MSTLKNQHYWAGCKCAHAASSSGRFQASANAGSLRIAVSWVVEDSFSKIVTIAAAVVTIGISSPEDG